MPNKTKFIFCGGLNKKSVIISFVIILLGIINSCTKSGEFIDSPDFTPKLVVHGFIYPGIENFEVSVNYTIPAGRQFRDFDGKYVVEDARVFIDNTFGDTLFLHFNKSTNSYQNIDAGFNILEGHLYTLTVETTDRYSTRATTKVPFHNHTIYSELDINESNGVVVFDCKLIIPDPPGQDNYFFIHGMLSYERMSNQNAPDFEQGLNQYVEFNYFPRSDERKDGITFNFHDTHSAYLNPFIGERIEGVVELKYKVFHMDKHAYKYQEFIEDYNIKITDPLHQGPIYSYSNFDNGFGVFGSFALDEIIINIEKKPGQYLPRFYKSLN